MEAAVKRYVTRQKRHRSLRRKIRGTEQKPRLAVFRSSRHIYVQAIDDEKGVTLCSASTKDKELQDGIKSYSGNKETAGLVGKAIAEKLSKQSIQSVVFDRGGFLYHGRVRALAEGAREGGLVF